ncbi:hypothetical protein scyTo_0003692 [Scyliorhinus torazame]|uniref:Uncharacterized protein n=1 Tax=Scyliorhinus torazame TaxID=75743 RepID=A0A401PNE9_SCYTO|nr:hypothetical protein [Scyliorhinus torazame]
MGDLYGLRVPPRVVTWLRMLVDYNGTELETFGECVLEAWVHNKRCTVDTKHDHDEFEDVIDECADSHVDHKDIDDDKWENIDDEYYNIDIDDVT